MGAFVYVLTALLASCGDAGTTTVKDGEADWNTETLVISPDNRECPVWGGWAVFRGPGDAYGDNAKEVEVVCVDGPDLHVLEHPDPPDADAPYYLCIATEGTVTKELISEGLCVPRFGRESAVEKWMSPEES